MRSRTQSPGTAPLLILAVAFSLSLAPMLCKAWVTYHFPTPMPSYVESGIFPLELNPISVDKTPSTNSRGDATQTDESIRWHDHCEQDLLQFPNSPAFHLGSAFIEARKPGVGHQHGIATAPRVLSRHEAGEEDFSSGCNARIFESMQTVSDNVDSSAPSQDFFTSNSTRDFCQTWQAPPSRQQTRSTVSRLQHLTVSTPSLVKGLMRRLQPYSFLSSGNSGQHDIPGIRSVNNKTPYRPTQSLHLPTTTPTSGHLPPGASQPSELSTATNDTRSSPAPAIPKYSTSELKDDAVMTVASSTRSQSSFLAIVISVVVAVLWF